MGFRTSLGIGFAVLLQEAGIGTWDTSGVYAADQTGIFLRVIPPTPDNAIQLSVYNLSDDPSLSDSTYGMQIVTRTAGQDPRPTDDLSDDIFDALHGLQGVTLSTDVRVNEVQHRSGVSLGQDDSKRWAYSDNFYVEAWRPSPNRQ